MADDGQRGTGDLGGGRAGQEDDHGVQFVLFAHPAETADRLAASSPACRRAASTTSAPA